MVTEGKIGAYHNLLKAIKLGKLHGRSASDAEIKSYYRKEHDITTTLRPAGITRSRSNPNVYVSAAKSRLGKQQYEEYKDELKEWQIPITRQAARQGRRKLRPRKL